MKEFMHVVMACRRVLLLEQDRNPAQTALSHLKRWERPGAGLGSVMVGPFLQNEKLAFHFSLM